MSTVALRRVCNLVFKQLGKGHTEKIYHRAVYNELLQRKIRCSSEVPLPVHCSGKCVGFVRCDIITDGSVVEIKANRTVIKSKSVDQVNKYVRCLRDAGYRTQKSWVVINFNQKSGEVNMATRQLKASRSRKK